MGHGVYAGEFDEGTSFVYLRGLDFVFVAVEEDGFTFFESAEEGGQGFDFELASESECTYDFADGGACGWGIFFGLGGRLGGFVLGWFIVRHGGSPLEYGSS